jgi:hypothetical protein
MESPADFLERLASHIQQERSPAIYQYAGYTGGTGSLLLRDKASKVLVVFRPWRRGGPVGFVDLLRATVRLDTYRGKAPGVFVHVGGSFRENAIRFASGDQPGDAPPIVLIGINVVARELAVHGESRLPQGVAAAIDAFRKKVKYVRVGDVNSLSQSPTPPGDHQAQSRPPGDAEPGPRAPTLFVSYTSESAQHREWVVRLAMDLIRNGVDVRIDEWDLPEFGHDLHRFMETCVRESDHVLLVCTPEYAKRANNRSGGVGVESTIITGEYYSPEKAIKLIPIVRSKAGVQASLPSYLASKLAIDFTRDSEYEARLEELLRRLFDRPRYARPALGPPPRLTSDEL